MKNRKKGALTGLFLLLAVLLLGLMGAKPLYFLYRDVSFSWQERSEAEWAVKTFAQEHGLSYGEYPQSLIDLYGRNPETEEFVLNYPFRDSVEVTKVEADLSEGVPLFMQWDRRWGYIKYGSDVAGITGCGPNCLAMAGYYVTGGDERFLPDQMYAFASENGYYAAGHGSSWTLISEGGVKLGLDVTEIPLVKKRMMDNLEVGNPIICSMRAGDFTTTGHYIVLVGAEDGMFRVNDPNSHANSEKLWSYEQIEGQIRNLWVIRNG